MWSSSSSTLYWSSIWFFIDVSLLGNGNPIVQAGIRELLNPPAQLVVFSPARQHLVGRISPAGRGVYCIRFAPRRIGKV